MSASLVGSEMCIRDSLTLTPPHRPRCVAARGSPGRRCSWALRAPRAVSYTHLTLPTICSV
eukprot:6668299-Alexandrium_andersonii.AAC.1